MDLVSFVKQSRWIYRTYYYLASFFVNVLKCFVKTDDRLILYVAYGGRYFIDSPKCIYDAMLKDDRFQGYKLVWAFRHPENFTLTTPKIKISSFSYLTLALKARCWVTNVSVERGLNFKGKHTFYLQTTHTSLPKRIARDDDNSAVPFPKGFKYKYDCVCAQSTKEKEILKGAYGLSDDQVIVSGYPKNDILADSSLGRGADIRKKLGIPTDRITILYAPTYRDMYFGEMKCPVDFKKWERLLGDQYVVLFRAHPVVANATEIDSSSEFIYDVSSYPDNVDLMMASDILISDYSGIFFEYAVQKKPMFCYAYDYDEYVSCRKLYFDIREKVPGGFMTEEELLATIKTGRFDSYSPVWDKFREDYVAVSGNATKICVEKIYKNINEMA